jgi:hypothetical protein
MLVLNSFCKQYNIFPKIVRSDISYIIHSYPPISGMFHCFAGTKKISLSPCETRVIPKKTKSLPKKNATPPMVNRTYLKKPQVLEPPTKIPINARRKAETQTLLAAKQPVLVMNETLAPSSGPDLVAYRNINVGHPRNRGMGIRPLEGVTVKS